MPTPLAATGATPTGYIGDVPVYRADGYNYGALNELMAAAGAAHAAATLALNRTKMIALTAQSVPVAVQEEAPSTGAGPGNGANRQAGNLVSV